MTRRIVVDMRDRRPIWTLPAWVVDRIRRVLPDNWDMVVIGSLSDASGDGAHGVSGETLAAVADAEIYLGLGVPASLLRAGPRLRWVHTGTAGVGASLSPELLARDVIFTNSAGVHGPPIADTVLAVILHFARGLDFAVRGQAEARWWSTPFHGEDSPVREIAGGIVGILGLGGVGREVARRVTALGARVVALKRRPPARAPEGMEGVEVLAGPEGLARLAREPDYLVLTAPETRETQGMIGPAFLSQMKPSTVLINVARGSLVDEDALVEALRTGRLRGAGLDVFRTEPIPPDHPLWRLPNVLIMPHVSACTPRYWERECALIEENLRRYLEGLPLLNVVDREAGY
ncbi:MAG: D-2-hydroxyacid dehydrogenase [Gemmatimonadetes bacterium]|nr:D-2-hydroxyacid dehydrogenase [Gemmatimonadota bacterium]